MEHFIGRKNELKKLEELYQTKDFQMAVIYGRRRIGKSTLISKFLQNKKAIYYICTKIGSERNVELLSKQVVQTLSPEFNSVSFKNLEDLLEFLTQNLSIQNNQNEKIVFVIDEFPYWAEKDESVLSIFQKFIDSKWQDKNLLFILCGSALSFMENKVLSEKSPLFGRRSIQIKLEAFDYLESAEFVPNYTNEEKAICFGITGGVAKYLSLIDNSKTLDENIKNQFFNKMGYLYDETKNLLTQEFSDIKIVNNIIEQIASGSNTVILISDKIHEKEQTVLYSLEKLINIGIVEKLFCITEEKNKKKTQYILKDQMFRFWYAFIPEAMSAIEIDKGDIYFEKIVKNRLHLFMGKIFEDMCRTFTLKIGLEGKLNCFVTNVGTWWGSELIENEEGTKKAQSTDIDVVALSPSEKSIITGECKFKNEKIDKFIYENLIRRSKLIHSGFNQVQYLLFSLSGFSDYLLSLKNDNLKLFELDDLYKVTY